MDFEDIILYIGIMVCMFLLVLFGAIVSMPDELKNGCIMYEQEIYCKEGK